MDMYVVWAAFFTAVLYYFDYRKNHDVTYFTSHSFLAWRTPLGSFVFIYFLLGLVVALAYFFGIDVGLEKPLPELVKNFFRDGVERPNFVEKIIAGFILASTTRILASSKTIPGYDGTIDMAIEFLLKKEHEDKNIEDIVYKGKQNFIRKLILKYKRSHKTDITVPVLLTLLRTYLKNTGTYKNPENVVLLEGLQQEQNVEVAFFTLATAGFGKRRLHLLIE